MVHKQRCISCSKLTISTTSKLCLDAVPLPAKTSEKGFFIEVFVSFLDTYGSLAKMFTYDAGANSRAGRRRCELDGRIPTTAQEYAAEIRSVLGQ